MPADECITPCDARRAMETTAGCGRACDGVRRATPTTAGQVGSAGFPHPTVCGTRAALRCGSPAGVVAASSRVRTSRWRRPRSQSTQHSPPCACASRRRGARLSELFRKSRMRMDNRLARWTGLLGETVPNNGHVDNGPLPMILGYSEICQEWARSHLARHTVPFSTAV